MSGYVPRKPRHRSTEPEVEVIRSDAEDDGTLTAELVNLSRDGYQLRVSRPMAISESITTCISDEQTGLDVRLPAVVRWRRPDEGATWLVGCLSDAEIDLESLGELFLNGILLTDSR